MRVPRIYTDCNLASGQQIDLDERAARHVGTVLRMQAGRELTLFNGQGGEYRARVTEVHKKSVRVRIEDFADVERESSLRIHLGLAISRGERMDWALQKATELGVSEITPLFSERTEVKLSGARQDKKQQHWHQIITSSCEQCQRNRLPVIHAASSLDTWLATVDSEVRFVLHHRTQAKLSDIEAPASAALLIGPEGGLSTSEIERAVQSQFQPLALGPRVLRTETAPVAAISILQFLWGDL